VSANRVAYIEHHGDIIGGGQFSLLALMGHLRAYEALCLCGAEGSMSAAVRRAGIDVQIMAMPPLRWQNAWAICAAIRHLRRLLRRRRIALLHANGSRSMFYAGLAGALAGVPVVWHVRIAQRDGRWDAFLSYWARRIIAISAAVAERFAKMEAEDRTRVDVVHNGVDIAALAGGDAVPWHNVWGAGPLVGMVAQLIPWKRQGDFICAMARVARVYPQARFVIVGEEPAGSGEYLAELEALVDELNLRPKIVFAGFCDDVAGIFAALDVVVLCSENEPFGRVLIEAMAAATPVVATCGGGVPEIVVEGETGYMMAVGDVEGIACAVEKLLADPVRARAMGAAGLKRAHAFFSVETHVAKVEELYGQLLTAGA